MYPWSSKYQDEGIVSSCYWSMCVEVGDDMCFGVEDDVMWLCMGSTMVNCNDERVAQWGRRIHWTAVHTEAELNINLPTLFDLEGIDTKRYCESYIPRQHHTIN
jgi:hypothetical protein